MPVIRVGLTGKEVRYYGNLMTTLRDELEESGGSVTPKLRQRWVSNIIKEARVKPEAAEAVADRYLGPMVEEKKRGNRTTQSRAGS